MSQYLNFSIRCKDQFIPLNSYSNSNLIYELFSPYVPFEKVCPVTFKMLDAVQREINEALRNNADETAFIKGEKRLVAGFSNTPDEKLRCLSDLKIKEDTLEELTDDYKNCFSITAFLHGMLEEAKYNNTENEFLYAGIACRHPTINDIDN